MPCNTPVLLPPSVCVLCSKIYSLFGHYLLCLTEGHPKRALGPQRAPLSQTLIGERFHQVLRRNSPLAEVSREYLQRVMREWATSLSAGLVAARDTKDAQNLSMVTSFHVTMVGAIIAPKTPKCQLENATCPSEVALISGGSCVLPFPTVDSGCLEAIKGREGKNWPLNGISLNRVTRTATRWVLKAE